MHTKVKQIRTELANSNNTQEYGPVFEGYDPAKENYWFNVTGLQGYRNPRVAGQRVEYKKLTDMPMETKVVIEKQKTDGSRACMVGECGCIMRDEAGIGRYQIKALDGSICWIKSNDVLRVFEVLAYMMDDSEPEPVKAWV